MEKRTTPVTRWLRSNRGGTSQAALVADLELVTGWKLLRENYSKYETGTLSPEPETLARFVAYWAAKGMPGPDLTPPPVPVPVIDPMVRIALAVEDIARTLQSLREDMAGQSAATSGEVRSLGELLSATLAGMRAEP